MNCYFGPFVSDKIVLRNKYISTYSMIIMQTDRSGLINIVYAVTPSVSAQNNLSEIILPVRNTLVSGSVEGRSTGKIHFLYSGDKLGREKVREMNTRKSVSITASHEMRLEKVGLSFELLNRRRAMQMKLPVGVEIVQSVRGLVCK